MDKKIVYAIALASIVVGFSAGCLCACFCNKSKLAIVDVVNVVSKSEQVKQLKEEQNAKAQELNAWLQKVQEEVKNEKDKDKQTALLNQYNAEFAQKREQIQQDYAKKLQTIDESITKTITDEAKKQGYQVVIAKEFAIYGKNDITEDVAAKVK